MEKNKNNENHSAGKRHEQQPKLDVQDSLNHTLDDVCKKLSNEITKDIWAGLSYRLRSYFEFEFQKTTSSKVIKQKIFDIVQAGLQKEKEGYVATAVISSAIRKFADETVLDKTLWNNNLPLSDLYTGVIFQFNYMWLVGENYIETSESAWLFGETIDTLLATMRKLFDAVPNEKRPKKWSTFDFEKFESKLREVKAQ